MPARWSTRWTPSGTNSAGDQMYSRAAVNQSNGGGYDEMTKAELQELLEEKGLPKSGTKEELIERLTS